MAPRGEKKSDEVDTTPLTLTKRSSPAIVFTKHAAVFLLCWVPGNARRCRQICAQGLASKHTHTIRILCCRPLLTRRIQTRLYSFRLDCSIVSLTAAKTNRIFSVSAEEGKEQYISHILLYYTTAKRTESEKERIA